MESSRIPIDTTGLSSPQQELSAIKHMTSGEISEASIRDSRLKRLSKYRDYVSHLSMLEQSVQQADDLVNVQEVDRHLEGLPFPQIAFFDPKKTRRRMRKEHSDLALTQHLEHYQKSKSMSNRRQFTQPM